MAASSRAEQLLAAALQYRDIPKSHSQENDTKMNASANASATAANLNEAASAIDSAEQDIKASRRRELEELNNVIASARARVKQLQSENTADELLAGVAQPSTARTVLKYATVTAGAIGLGALGLWAYGRFSGRGAEEVIQSAGEAVASAGNAIADAA